MNLFKIAWRSIQHRGFGSWLTIISMALGVMMVVSVLSIHGLVSRSFKSNNSFGYNMIVGARGGAMQLTMNSVYYLSQPVENIPYEYYLAFVDKETRQRELKNSIAWNAKLHNQKIRQINPTAAPGLGGWGAALTQQLTEYAIQRQQIAAMEYEQLGLFSRYADVAIPLCLGDFYVDPVTGAAYRCIGTNSDFFTKLVLDVDTEEKFEFSAGRPFEYHNQENGFFEAVIGATVARRCGLKIGDTVKPTHGDPNSASAHVHDNPFTIVGILKATETPNDRAVFLNMEGFYLMDGHTKPLSEESVLNTTNRDAPPPTPQADEEFDLFADETEDENRPKAEQQQQEDDQPPQASLDWRDQRPFEIQPAQSVQPAKTVRPVVYRNQELPGPALIKESEEAKGTVGSAWSAGAAIPPDATRTMPTPLPIEQREVTSILVRTARKNDPWGLTAHFLISQINAEDDLESALAWSPFRPERTQKSSQAVSPVEQVTALFQLFVDPIRWLLLALTCMICVVSALSILVGIYNSMNQRQHEIAIIRALGASRGRVMAIMLGEAILLALVGGMLGWIGGHALNALLSPFVESQTGVSIGFFDFAPGLSLADTPWASLLPKFLSSISISSEFLIIPGLILLAVLVGIYPAVNAYKTDVSRALAK
jgi:ABC-type antimicrobial peptide transport system permease subunit